MKQQDGTIFQFLSGSHSFEGVWFGDAHPNYPGRPFWWRPLLASALEERDREIAEAASHRTAELEDIVKQMTGDFAELMQGSHDRISELEEALRGLMKYEHLMRFSATSLQNPADFYERIEKANQLLNQTK